MYVFGRREDICYCDGVVTRGWKKLYNEHRSSRMIMSVIICSLVARCFGDQMRRDRREGHVTCMEAKRNACRDLVVKPKGRTPLLRHDRRWERNIKMHIVISVGGCDLDSYSLR